MMQKYWFRVVGAVVVAAQKEDVSIFLSSINPPETLNL